MLLNPNQRRKKRRRLKNNTWITNPKKIMDLRNSDNGKIGLVVSLDK